jgi:hypothetical protein
MFFTVDLVHFSQSHYYCVRVTLEVSVWFRKEHRSCHVWLGDRNYVVEASMRDQSCRNGGHSSSRKDIIGMP